MERKQSGIADSDGAQPLKPGRSAARTKERILRNAGRLFSRYPYELVTLRQIAALSEINVALIVRYYGSKKELFCAVLDSLGAQRMPLRREDMLGDLADRAVHSLEENLEDDGQLSILNILMLSSQSREAMPVIQERIKGFFMDLAAAAGQESVPAGFMLTSCTLGVLMLRRLLPADYELLVSSADMMKAMTGLQKALRERDGKECAEMPGTGGRV